MARISLLMVLDLIRIRKPKELSKDFTYAVFAIDFQHPNSSTVMARTVQGPVKVSKGFASLHLVNYVFQ